MNVWSDLKHMRAREYVGEPLVDAEDQTTKGAVTPVKKQEQCGLCWAFSDHEFLVGSSRVPDSGHSIRAPSVDVSPRSPKSPRSSALLEYPSSPTVSAGLSTRLQLPLPSRSPVEVDIFSPRSQSPISSPVRTSLVFTRAEGEFDAEHQRDVNVVLQVTQRQGELNTRMECDKSTISTSIPLEGVFKELDKSGKGHVTDSDRWHQWRTRDSVTRTARGLCHCRFRSQL